MEEKLVIVGGGIAGFETAVQLERKTKAEITLIDPGEELVFYPSVTEIIEGEEPERTTINYSKKFRKRKITHVQQEIDEIRPENNSIIQDEEEIKYSKMVVAVGAATNFYGVDETHCYSLKDIQDVKEIRDRLEKIETAVIAGGGSTGIEAAGALLEASEDLDIKVIQAEDRLLTQNLEKLSEKTEKLLAGRGVEIIKNTLVTKVNLDSVEVNSGKRVDSDLTIWAGGLKNREILEETDLPTDKDGVKTEKTMKVEGRDDIYAVGDAASYSGGEKRAFHALKEAKTAASNIKRELEGKKNLEEKGHIWDPQLIYMGGTTGLEIGKRSHIGRLPDIMRRYFVDKRYMYLRKNIL